MLDTEGVNRLARLREGLPMVIMGVVLIILGLLVANLHALLIVGVILRSLVSSSTSCPWAVRAGATTDEPTMAGGDAVAEFAHDDLDNVI